MPVALMGSESCAVVSNTIKIYKLVYMPLKMDVLKAGSVARGRFSA